MCKSTLPNVLIISHNVLSNTSNMGKTLASFFQGYPINKISQIYFHSETPNSTICNNYFKITDFDIIKSKILFKNPGHVLGIKDISTNIISTHQYGKLKYKIYQFGKKRKPYKYLLRNLIWEFYYNKNQKMINWIISFNPSIIFVAAGDYYFLFKLVSYLKKKFKIKTMIFIGDDYFFNNQKSLSPFYYLNNFFYNKEFTKLLKNSQHILTASDEMKDKYCKFFNIKGSSIFPSIQVNKDLEIVKNKKIKISYFGNISLNRWKSLLEIGKILKKRNLFIDVYSGNYLNDRSIMKQLVYKNGIVFHGSISSQEVKLKIASSSILLHVESFDKKYIDRIKYSFSTKIPESLASGKCFFVFGPKGVSSINYLLKNKAAHVVTSIDKLEKSIFNIIDNPLFRNRYIKEGMKLAKKNHDPHINLLKFRKILSSSTF